MSKPISSKRCAARQAPSCRSWRKRNAKFWGIGSLLIRTGLAQARADGWEVVFVLGEPAYYLRFGFDPNKASGFESPYSGPYLMAIALQGPELPCANGRVEYAPAFAGVE